MITDVSRYDVIWNTPSQTDHGSMPLGNGETAASVWATNDGRLHIYLSRTDSLNENDNNDKIAKIVLSLDPNPFAGKGFCQQLHLNEGRISITAGEPGAEIRLSLWVDSEAQLLYVTGEADAPYTVTAAYHIWRTEPKPVWIEQALPDEQVYIMPDTLLFADGQAVVYHANGNPNLKLFARVTSVANEIEQASDYLTGRIYGCAMWLSDSEVCGNTLRRENCTGFVLTAATESSQQYGAAEFVSRLIEMNRTAADAEVSRKRTADWWKAYWENSYIYVEGDTSFAPAYTEEIAQCEKEQFPAGAPVPSAVTQGYLLTRYLFACTARGNQPIRFNGLQFTTMPGGGKPFDFSKFALGLTEKPVGEPDLNVNPDFHPWGELTLWQNIRLPYESMLARGEFEELKVLFRYYAGHRAIDRVYAQRFYGAKGQHNTEIAHSSGVLAANIYGFDRTNKTLGYSENRWGGAVDISPGLELAFLMLDYAAYTSDTAFLQQEILPYVKELMEYIETRFPLRKAGKICLVPLHAVETYHDAYNPMPVVAGMQAVLQRILALPEELVADRAYFAKMLDLTPALPTEQREGKTVLAPAEGYAPTRHNVELPELYTVFPFRLFTAVQENDALAQDTFDSCEVFGNFHARVIGESPSYASYSGWQYVGLCAALLGRGEQSADILAHNCGLQNPGHRFPAMWGPVYDAVPDVDHGANILTQLQWMLMQTDGDKIFLLPAWKREWNVSFKLHAPQQTTVEVCYENGRLAKLAVTPESRLADVILPEFLSKKGN